MGAGNDVAVRIKGGVVHKRNYGGVLVRNGIRLIPPLIRDMILRCQ
jgi:hypothetical protein